MQRSMARRGLGIVGVLDCQCQGIDCAWESDRALQALPQVTLGLQTVSPKLVLPAEDFPILSDNFFTVALRFSISM
jgi:hypothetical protein